MHKNIILFIFIIICLFNFIGKSSCHLCRHNCANVGVFLSFGAETICLYVLQQVQVQRRSWIYFNGESQQVGGFVKEFTNIAFLTVKVRPQ